MGSSTHTEVSSPISFTRKVIIDIKEYRRSTLKTSIEKVNRSTNTSPIQDPVNNTSNTHNTHTQVDTQEETLLLESLPTEDSGKQNLGLQGDKTMEHDIVHNKDEMNDNILPDDNHQKSE